MPPTLLLDRQTCALHAIDISQDRLPQRDKPSTSSDSSDTVTHFIVPIDWNDFSPPGWEIFHHQSSHWTESGIKGGCHSGDANELMPKVEMPQDARPGLTRRLTWHKIGGFRPCTTMQNRLTVETMAAQEHGAGVLGCAWLHSCWFRKEVHQGT